MDDLITTIKQNLKIPFIEMGDTLLKECFLVTPLDIDGYRGDGHFTETVQFYQIDIYSKKRVRTMELAKSLISIIENLNGTCSDARYTYENGYLRAIVKVEILEDKSL